MVDNPICVGEFPNIHVSASYFFIVSTTITCWKCQKQTQVSGIIIPAEYEIVEKDRLEISGNHSVSGPCALAYIGRTTKAIYDIIKNYNPTHTHDYSRPVKFRYHINHCSNCSFRIGDNYLYWTDDKLNPIDEFVFYRARSWRDNALIAKMAIPFKGLVSQLLFMPVNDSFRKWIESYE